MKCPVLDTTGVRRHQQADELREQGPTQVIVPGGVPVWSLNRAEDIRQVLKDPRVTKSARKHWPKFINGEIPPDWELISWVAMDNMVTASGADHVRLRRLVGGAFTRQRTERMRPRVQQIVDQLLDSLEHNGSDPIDLREAYAYPLPAIVVAEMIGMSDDARRATAQVIDMMVDTTVTPEQAQAILSGWRSAMVTLIEQKRQTPGQDITSDLIAARDEDGTCLSEEELVDTIFAILGAGSETTINFMDNAITALLSHPDQLAALRDGEHTWDDVIDEVLRLESPLAHLPLRYAAEDIQVSGVAIPQGDPILVNYAAVGRDPSLHPDRPCEFDLSRKDKQHLSFGLGPHFCLGSQIAVMVATEGLSRLFDRFPHLSLATPADQLPTLSTFIMNGHAALPVHLGQAAVSRVA